MLCVLRLTLTDASKLNSLPVKVAIDVRGFDPHPCVGLVVHHYAVGTCLQTGRCTSASVGVSRQAASRERQWRETYSLCRRVDLALAMSQRFKEMV